MFGDTGRYDVCRCTDERAVTTQAGAQGERPGDGLKGKSQTRLRQLHDDGNLMMEERGGGGKRVSTRARGLDGRAGDGTMVVVKGMLSMKADTMAHTQMSMTQATPRRRRPSGTTAIRSAVKSAMYSMTPISSMHLL